MASKKTETFKEVELGFLEKCDSPDQLTSSNFPSKVGGKPAWLDPVHLPSVEQLSCKECHKPCIFLLQIYAPLSDDPETYHRSLFIFICLNKYCHRNSNSNAFRVLRCNLPKSNLYYSNEEEVESTNDPVNVAAVSFNEKVEPTVPLCNVCGCHAPNRCGQCRKVHYCSEDHQKLDWKSNHKQICKKLLEGDIGTVCDSNGILFDEYEIVTETETNETSNKKQDKDRMEEYLSYIKTDKYKELPDPLAIDDIQNSVKEDKTFSHFKECVSQEPQQVLRFQPGGKPLLISNHCPPSIPCCEICQSPRQFEFQIMPQLLYYLKLDSTSDSSSCIDWGTLLIYTCATNCTSETNDRYVEEFLWKQSLT